MENKKIDAKEIEELIKEREKDQSILDRRRTELLIALRISGNKRPILDRILIFLGIVGLGICIIWLLTASILPMSYFGMIGSANRYVIGNAAYGQFIDVNTGEIIADGQLGLASVSAFDASWNNVTYGMFTYNAGVYDLFNIMNPSVRWIGGLGCTIVFLAAIFGFITLISLYIRDFIIIGKTLITIAKDRSEAQSEAIKQTIRDVNDLYKDDSEKDEYVEVKIPAKQIETKKKPGRPKGTTKTTKPEKPAEKEPAIPTKTENHIVTPIIPKTEEVHEEPIVEETKSEQSELTEAQEYAKQLIQQANEKPIKPVDKDDIKTLSNDELNELLSGQATLEELMARHNQN